MICRGWCRSNDVEILKTSQQQDDRVIARLGFLKILCKLEAFFFNGTDLRNTNGKIYFL